VEIIGDIESVPTLQPGATETIDPLVVGATQTREAVLAAPGGALTVTAQSRIIDLPEGAEQPGSSDLNGNSGIQADVKPTFTYPPGVLVGVPTLEATRDVKPASPAAVTDQSPLPPIIPIVALGVLGTLGLAVSVLRG